MELMKAKLAEWLGGSPEDYERLALAFWALSHGTSMLLISKTVRDDHNRIAGRTSDLFNTVRDAHGNLVSINSSDPGLLIRKK